MKATGVKVILFNRELSMLLHQMDKKLKVHSILLVPTMALPTQLLATLITTINFIFGNIINI